MARIAKRLLGLDALEKRIEQIESSRREESALRDQKIARLEQALAELDSKVRHLLALQLHAFAREDATERVRLDLVGLKKQLTAEREHSEKLTSAVLERMELVARPREEGRENPRTSQTSSK